MSVRRSLRVLADASRSLARAAPSLLRSPGPSARDLANLPQRVRAAHLTQLWNRILVEFPDGPDAPYRCVFRPILIAHSDAS
jgi:hypothetical protein